MNRKQKSNAPVPPRTKQEIQAETVELNTHAKQVQDSYKQLYQMWEDRQVPFQHRVAFIESVKVLDMKMMAQFFAKEV